MKTSLFFTFSAVILSLTGYPALAADSIKKAPFVVVIDPGHGGEPVEEKSKLPWSKGVDGQGGDGGAANHAYTSGRSTGGKTVLEKDLTLEYAEEIKSKLDSIKGIKTILTRTRDVQMGAMERAAIAVKNDADVFLSIHFNMGGGNYPIAFYVQKDHPKWQYFHFTNPYVERDKYFGAKVASALALAWNDHRVTPFPHINFEPEYWQNAPEKDKPYQVHSDTFIGLKDGYRWLGFARQETHLWNCAVCLLEMQFLDNNDVERWIASRDQRSKARKEAASAISRAVETYMNEFYADQQQHVKGTPKLYFPAPVPSN